MRCFGQFASRSAMSRGCTCRERIAATRPNAIQKPTAKVSATWTNSGSSTARFDMWLPNEGPIGGLVPATQWRPDTSGRSDPDQDLDREHHPHDQQDDAGDDAGVSAPRRRVAAQHDEPALQDAEH